MHSLVVAWERKKKCGPTQEKSVWRGAWMWTPQIGLCILGHNKIRTPASSTLAPSSTPHAPRPTIHTPCPRHLSPLPHTEDKRSIDKRLIKDKRSERRKLPHQYFFHGLNPNSIIYKSQKI